VERLAGADDLFAADFRDGAFLLERALVEAFTAVFFVAFFLAGMQPSR